jgi:hypothetical protein
VVCEKANRPPDRLGKVCQATDVVEALQDRFLVQGELAVLLAQASLYRSAQDIDATGKVMVRPYRTAELHERLDDLNADFNCAGGPQNVGQHQAAVLSEGEGQSIKATAFLGRSCKLHERPPPLIRREPEHEFRRESVGVAPDLLIQALGPDSIKCGQVSVQHDPMPAKEHYSPGDRAQICFRHVVTFCDHITHCGRRIFAQNTRV